MPHYWSSISFLLQVTSPEDPAIAIAFLVWSFIPLRFTVVSVISIVNESRNNTYGF